MVQLIGLERGYAALRNIYSIVQFFTPESGIIWETLIHLVDPLPSQGTDVANINTGAIAI
jgi:hypothetical protein